ncbi:hypothetical protein GOP47_0005244 [Adiantum capillus-veneris]|uniref:Uncharacterized protein n=1 Tax=Adiantum capillus-veneris TaxID=13818 RepID=A0A9D4ZNY9_ADICA|nr:hypothetical protein GOP47_0005244 [Adiantum capillus-veneris]
MEEQAVAGKDRRVESLGWLTESSIMPKKKKAIEGVGASSIVELRAQLYRTQEDAKRIKTGDADAVLHRSLKKTDTFYKKNTGVEERANRDKLQLKAETDGSASYAALEKKAQLYEKLARGELSDEDEREKYSVDFLRKGLLEDEFRSLEAEGAGEVAPMQSNEGPTQDSSSIERRSGIGWSSDKAVGISQEHKILVREVNQETIEAREQATLLKQLSNPLKHILKGCKCFHWRIDRKLQGLSLELRLTAQF